MACRGSGVRVPPAPPPHVGQVSVVPRRPPFVLTRRGLCHTDEERVASMTITSTEARMASDGRRWSLRPARPTDARALADLFAAVRREGRWLVTPPPAVSEPSEGFFIGEMIRDANGVSLGAEAGGGGGG